VDALGGTVEVSGTPEQTWSMLENSTQRWRLIVQPGAEEMLHRGTVCRQDIFFVIQTTRGLQADRGADVFTRRATGGAAGSKSVMELKDEVRKLVASVRFVTEAGDYSQQFEDYKVNGGHLWVTRCGWLGDDGNNTEPVRNFQLTAQTLFTLSAVTEDDTIVIEIES